MLVFSDLSGLFLHTQIIIMGETLAFFVSLGCRLIYRSFRRYAMDMERSENALIVGAGNAGYLMLTEIYRGTSYPYNVVGFLDDLKESPEMVIFLSGDTRRCLGKFSGSFRTCLN